MSSIVRRIEKRIMKNAGMKKFSVEVPNPDQSRGAPPLVTVSAIADRAGEIYGKQWPRAIPRKFLLADPFAKDLAARVRRETDRAARAGFTRANA